MTNLQAQLLALRENKEAIENATQAQLEKKIPVAAILPSPFQARRDFGDEELQELADSILEHGLLQPVVVRQIGENSYELIAGERRWRAFQLIKEDRINAKVVKADDHEANLLGILENIQRKQLNPYEVAQVIVKLVAVALGSSAEATAQALAKHSPSEEVQIAYREAMAVIGKQTSLDSFRVNLLPALKLEADLIQAIDKGATYNAVLLLRNIPIELRQPWLEKLIDKEARLADVEAFVRQYRKQEAKPSKSRVALDWQADVAPIRKALNETHISKLDGRKQRKVERLLKELAEALEL